MSQYRRRGARGIVIIGTVVSVATSVLATIVAMSVVSGVQGPPTAGEVFGYLSVAVLVPCIIAPLVITLVMRLLVKLDEALAAMKRLSTTDALTGSANRLGFFNAASQSLLGLQSAGECLVAMVDLDQFKQLNDTYGHQVGDSALQLLAQRLAMLVGDRGVVGRIGGDEFALYVLGGASKLQKMQDELLSDCQMIELDSLGDSTVRFSASVGVVRLLSGEGISDALGRADAQLYQCKRSRPRGLVRSSRA